MGSPPEDRPSPSTSTSSNATATTMTPPSTSTKAKPQLEKVRELFFVDNRMVTLVAGDKEFRLPLCVLAAKSKVFRQQCIADKHSLQADGSLKFKLSDPPNYAEYFLRAVYDSGYFEPPPRKIIEIDHILGILDLSTRYGVGYLRKRALSHLASGYPTTLAEWQTVNETATFTNIVDHSAACYGINIHRSLTVLHTLSKVGAPWLMPAVFYQCARYELQELISHATWVKGPLSDELKKNLISGAFKQTEASWRILSFLQRAPEGCKTPSTCAESRRQHSEQLSAGDRDSELPKNSPLTIWDDGDWLFLDVCETCMKSAKDEHEQATEDFWAGLPDIYGMEGWDTLLELRDAAMV